MFKRVGAIVSIVVVGIILLTTIIMANVNINYGIRFNSPSSVWLNASRSTSDRLASTTQSQKIEDYLKNASKESALTALFKGEINRKAEIVSQEGKIVDLSAKYLISFKYNNEQTMKYGKKKFIDGNGDGHTYTQLVFALNEAEGESEYKVYVTADDDSDEDYSYYYKLDASLHDLYNYVYDILN